jgi:hypothetical protein
VEQQREDLRSRGEFERAENLLIEIETAGGLFFQPPGGKLEAIATNYVERLPDRTLAPSQLNVRYPSVVISGGVQFGKSSLLERIMSRVRDIGEDFAFADFSEFIPPSKMFDKIEERTDADLFQKLLSEWEIIGFDEEIPPNATPISWARKRFTEWAKEQEGKFNRKYLIIDTLDQAYEAIEEAAFANLLAFLLWIRNQMNKKPFDKLAILVTLSSRAWSGAYASVFQQSAHEIKLESFNVTEIESLLETFGISENAFDAAQIIFNEFGGHPHLTHLAAWELYQMRDRLATQGLALVEAVIRDAESVDRDYQTHWRRLGREVASMVSYNSDHLNALITELKKNYSYEGKGSEEFSARSLVAINLNKLKRLGLLMDHPERPILSRFYSIALKDEKNINIWLEYATE